MSARRVRLLICVIALALPTLAQTQRAAATPDTWSPAGSMATARRGHTATLLPAGNLLVAGGGR